MRIGADDAQVAVVRQCRSGAKKRDISDDAVEAETFYAQLRQRKWRNVVSRGVNHLARAANDTAEVVHNGPWPSDASEFLGHG